MKININMKKSGMKQRKGMALLFAGTLMFTAITSGCGKKDIDYDSVQQEETTQTGLDANGDSGTVSAGYDIPESCHQMIDPADSELESIEIAADRIQTFDTSGTIREYVKKRKRTPEYKEKVVNAVFDRDIQLSGEKAKTKADIENELDAAKQEYEDAKARKENGEAIFEEQYTDEIKRLEKMLDAASEDGAAAIDYSADLYKGICNDIEFELGFPCAEYPMAHFKMTQSLIQYRPQDGASEVDMIQLPMMSVEEYKEQSASMETGTESSQGNGQDGTTEEETEAMVHDNKCIYSVDEAKTIADDFLLDLGISDVQVKGVSDLMWAYYDDSGNPVGASEWDGYIFLYGRAAGTQMVADYAYYDTDYLSGEDGDIELDLPHESYTIYVDENGVINAGWKDYLEPTGQTDSVTLLSFDEMIQKAEKAIPEFYKKYKTGYREVIFDHLELGYCLRQTEDQDTYCFVPAWIFSRHEEADNDHDDPYTSQLVILDAVTGDLIDPVLLSESLNITADEDWGFIAEN